MSLYDVLIKNNLLDFDKVLLDKYFLLGLDEVDAVLLIKIYGMVKNNNSFNQEFLSIQMAESESNISKRIVKLAENGFITLDYDSEGRDIIGMEGILKRLNDCLVDEESKTGEEEKSNTLKDISNYAEKAFGRALSPIELQLLNHLVNEDHYDANTLEDAIDDCNIKHKHNIKYVDAYLQAKRETACDKVDYDLQEKFNNVYKKRR